MSESTLVSCSDASNAWYQVYKPGRLLSRTAQPSYHDTVEPSEDSAASADDSTATLRELKSQQKGKSYVNQTDTIEQSHFMNRTQAGLFDLFNAGVDFQVVDRLHDSIITAVDENFTGAIHLVTDSGAPQKKSTLITLINVLVARMFERGNSNFYFEIILSNLFGWPCS